LLHQKCDRPQNAHAKIVGRGPLHDHLRSQQIGDDRTTGFRVRPSISNSKISKLNIANSKIFNSVSADPRNAEGPAGGLPGPHID
jgi:hypothetical protein